MVWRGKKRAGVLVFLCLFGGAAQGRADGKTFVDVDIVGSYNPLGIKLQGEARRQGQGKEGAEGTWEGGVGLGVSPAYSQGWLRGAWTPAPYLVLEGRYDAFGFFGANGSLLSFSSPDEDFGPDALKDRKGDEQRGWGQRFLFRPTLRGKAGVVVVRSQTEVAYYRFRGDGPYCYEQEYDTLLRDGDLLLANRTQLLFDLAGAAGARSLYLGIFYEVARTRDAGIGRQRWGGLGYWEASQTTVFGGRPHAFVQVGVNTQDRNREGELFGALGAGVTFGP